MVFATSFLTCLVFIMAYFGVNYILGSLSFSFSFYVLGAYMLFANNRRVFKDENGGVYKRKIEQDDATTLSENLQALMKEKRLFENQKLKLGEVAAHLNCSPHQLSQFLNDNLGMSFSSYINEWRVDTKPF